MFSILKAGRTVFESMNVDAIVSIYSSTTQPCLRICDYVGTEIRLKNTVQKSSLKPPYAYDSLFSDQGELLAKLDAQSQRLSELAICENACATDDAYRLRDLIEELTVDINDGRYLMMINTGTIGKYVSKWGQREMVYLGKKYLQPVINRKRFLEHFPKSYGQKSIKRKLILKGLNLLDVCLDMEGRVIPGIPTLVICSEEPQTLILLLGIVNSTLPFFYIREKHPASSYNQGTTFTKEMINDLPIPQIGPKDRAKIISIVDDILAAKRRNPSADTSTMEAEIDQLVYRLYGLTAEEMAIVENSFAKKC
jgi:hypothetical protein